MMDCQNSRCLSGLKYWLWGMVPAINPTGGREDCAGPGAGLAINLTGGREDCDGSRDVSCHLPKSEKESFLSRVNF